MLLCAQALQLLKEGQEAFSNGEGKRAYDALVPAAALAPNNEDIADELAEATLKYPLRCAQA